MDHSSEEGRMSSLAKLIWLAVLVCACSREDDGIMSSIEQDACDPKVLDCTPPPGGGGGFFCGWDPRAVTSPSAAGPCRAYGCGAVDGQSCGSLALSIDNPDAHWKTVTGSIDVAGIVDGAGCGDFKFTCAPGQCHEPKLSGGDDCFNHNDRDFEFHFVPSNGT